MPRGQHPNSIKALEENRHKGAFNAETAVIAKEKSDQAKAIYKSLNEDLKERCTPERIGKMNDCIMRMAERGNLKAYELIRDGLGEKPADRHTITSESDVNEMQGILKQLGMLDE